MTTSPDDQVEAWRRAELDGDVHALDALLHTDFLGVGPFGFLLDRRQWMERFGAGMQYTAFDFTADAPTRYTDGTAIVVGTQTQRGSHLGRPVDGAFRVTLVLTGGPQWRLVAAH